MTRTYTRTGRAIQWVADTDSDFGRTHNCFKCAGAAYQYARRMLTLHPYVHSVTIRKLYRNADDWTFVKTMTREDV